MNSILGVALTLSYFVLLKAGATLFAYFEGFDQAWKTAPTPWEMFRGLFRPDRTPKRFIERNNP